MSNFPKRYLLNTNTWEVHDTYNYHTECMIYSMREEHKRFFDTLTEALAYPYYDGSKHNDGCAHCLPQYHTK
ncbi:MAG: hypothetical protein NSGCLCUN01_04046 [uncultured Clostridium sp.]